MTHVERVVRTKAGTERVWQYLSDFCTTNDWDPGTVRTERRSGDGGLGTVYDNTSRFLGRETDLVYTVVELDPGTRIMLRGENRTVTATDTITVESDDGAGTTGTKVTYRAELSFHGVARLAEPLLGLAFKRVGDEAEASLAAALGRL